MNNIIKALLFILFYIATASAFALYYYLAIPEDFHFSAYNQEFIKTAQDESLSRQLSHILRKHSTPHNYPESVSSPLVPDSIDFRQNLILHYSFTLDKQHINTELTIKKPIEINGRPMLPFFKKTYRPPHKTQYNFSEMKIPISPDLFRVLTDYYNNKLVSGDGPLNLFSRAFYFSAITITTIGYGDIIPLTDTARNAVACEALLGMIILGLCIGTLTNQKKKDL